MAGQIERTDHSGRRDNRNQNARQPFLVLEKQDDRQRAEPDGECHPVGSSFKNRTGNIPRASQRSFALDREAEELRQLADQYGQRNSIHVAVAYRLGEELSDKAQARDAGQNADRTRDNGHHAGQRYGAKGIAPGQRSDDAENDGCQSRIRPQDEDAAWAEQGVDQQRYDRRIQTMDARQARRRRVGNSNRDQHCRQDEPGEDVTRKPRSLILTESLEPRQPVDPMRHWAVTHSQTRLGLSAACSALAAIGAAGLRSKLLRLWQAEQ
jgi:hypothetical protein